MILLELREGRSTEQVVQASSDRIRTLPDALARALRWDQGKEPASHQAFTIATGLPVYFRDAHSPWQRGSNENTNGLLRQYFPKRANLSAHPEADLDAVADELNTRPPGGPSTGEGQPRCTFWRQVLPSPVETAFVGQRP